MRQRLEEAIKNSSEARAYFVFGVLLILRAWRAIPKLRPIHLILPATIALISILIIAAYTPLKFLFIFSTGLFIVLAIVMFPMLRQPSKPTAHWVKAND